MQKFLLFLILVLGVKITQAQTFSGTFNDTIPDAGPTVYFDIPVSGLPAVIDTFFGVEVVCLNMTHTWDADMEVKLISPDGTTATLFAGIGGDQDNFVNTCLGDTTYPALSTTSAPFTGTFAANGVLGNVNNGQNPNGVWRLACRDMAGQDIGILHDWQITFGNNPAFPFMFTSSNLPIAIINTNGVQIPNDPQVLAHLQIIDNGPGIRNYTNQTNFAYEGDILTELQGFSGPSYPKKNYDFDLIDSLGNKIDTTLLGMPSENDWIFKAEYLDHTLMKNTITYEMSRRMGRYAPRTRFCELVLNGEYIGVYSLTEKVKRNANRVDIAKLTPSDTTGAELTGGYIIEMNINGDPADWISAYLPINSATCNLDVEFKHVYPKVTDIHPLQHDYIKSYTDSFENVLNGTNFLDSLEGYRKYISVKSFIDFLICNEFSVNYDSYGRSTYLYKEKVTDGNQLHIGPPWDYDRAFDYDNPGTTDGWVWEITHSYWPFPFWWSRMWEDPVYRKQLACRWFSLRENTLSNDSFMVMIDTLKSRLYESQARNFTVWNELGSATYDDQIDSLKSYVNRRLNWIDMTLGVENVSLPVSQLPADTTICAGSLLNADIGPGYTYNWIPGSDSAQITLYQSGSYVVETKDEYGCYNLHSIDVTVSQPNASFTAVSNPGPNSPLWNFTPADTAAQLYHWTLEDSIYTLNSYQQSPNVTFLSAGWHTVTLALTDSIGCQATYTDSVFVVMPVGIVSLSPENSPVIYPNPVGNILNLTFPVPVLQDVSVTFYSTLGETMAEYIVEKGNQSIQIPVERLSQGIYFLKVRTGEEEGLMKIVKK
ncbi:MAG: CotH kinase family protein [Bacteroidia bacterium]|nr:CotH kinase family protein [Bacteroidia bacterium]